MKMGCNTVDFRTKPFDFALERIAAAGYEYVEVEANLKWCSHADPWKDDPLKFQEKVAAYGFKGVSAIGSHRELITSEQGVKDLKRSLEWASAAGVPVVLTGEGRMPEGMQEEEALRILKGRYQELLEVAARSKVYLAIEDHGSISLKPDGLPKLLQLAGSPWLAVNFDTANIHRGDYVGTDSTHYEWKLGAKTSYSEIELLKKVAKKVRHVHIKDVVGRNAVTLGKGEIDIRGCMQVLQQAGYEGVLSYETEGFEDPEQTFAMIKDSRAYMLQVLQELKG
jgi:sugar phosphate isomerase/epimerase